uniref:Uncharacterized protein n=1 Tax=Rhabditophanes sp. KR3021 TaxID=114890 RepID=A0AC35U9P1_9BILA
MTLDTVGIYVCLSTSDHKDCPTLKTKWSLKCDGKVLSNSSIFGATAEGFKTSAAASKTPAKFSVVSDACSPSSAILGAYSTTSDTSSSTTGNPRTDSV